MPITTPPTGDPFLDDADEPNDAFYRDVRAVDSDRPAPSWDQQYVRQTVPPRFTQAPKVVGCYHLGSVPYGGGSYSPLMLRFTHKPNWLHRLCMRVFLGFEWRDAP